MLKPKLSICCITYNHSNFILECLKGFESQIVNFEVEVIIHDDFSTDNTRELLLEYKKRRKILPLGIRHIYEIIFIYNCQ